MNNFDGVFFLSLATMTFGFFAGALGYALKSKCSKIKCCGCIEIDRNVELEAALEEGNITSNKEFENDPPKQRRSKTLNLSRISENKMEDAILQAVKNVNEQKKEEELKYSFESSMKNAV